jgi:homocysteine S-methyltransferase
MNFVDTLRQRQGILAEGAVAERLRRRDDVSLHATLFNAPLIYDNHGRRCLSEIYQQYHTIAVEKSLPILLFAPTWRVNEERMLEAGVSPRLNQDAVMFMRGLQTQWHTDATPVFIGGLIGPRYDCYSPDQALSAIDAEKFHEWQVEKLIEGDGVDFILGETFPAVSEALGFARACRHATVPYMISFVTGEEGRVLDGTSIDTAISMIDTQTLTPPLGYLVNCVHPSFLLRLAAHRPLSTRLIGILANASSKSHDKLEGATELHQDSLGEWCAQMSTLHKSHGVKILGGCCGTDSRHIACLAKGLVSK